MRRSHSRLRLIVLSPTNPFNWPRRKKWIVTALCCWFTFLTAFCGSSFATNLLAIRQDLGVSFELSLLATAIYPFGFVRRSSVRQADLAQGLAPLVTAPFSEVFGRNGMYLVTFAIHGIHFLPVALIRNIAAIIAFRFMGGCAGSTGSTMVGGSISDSACALEAAALIAQSGSRLSAGHRWRSSRWRRSSGRAAGPPSSVTSRRPSAGSHRSALLS